MVHEQGHIVCLPSPQPSFEKLHLFSRTQNTLTITLYSALDFYDFRMTLTRCKHTQFCNEPSRILLPHCRYPGHITVNDCSFLLPFLPKWKVRIPILVVAQCRKWEKRISSSLLWGSSADVTHHNCKWQVTFCSAKEDAIRKPSHLSHRQSHSVGEVHAVRGERQKVLFIQSLRSTESTQEMSTVTGFTTKWPLYPVNVCNTNRLQIILGLQKPLFS